MNKHELSKYYYLSKEIEQIQSKIDEIQSTYLSSSKIDGMPHERKQSSPQERIMMLIEKYQERLEQKKSEAIQEMLKIEKFADYF